jgi:hypothetical protein
MFTNPSSSSCSWPVNPSRTLFPVADTVVGSVGWLKFVTRFPYGSRLVDSSTWPLELLTVSTDPR